MRRCLTRPATLALGAWVVLAGCAGHRAAGGAARSWVELPAAAHDATGPLAAAIAGVVADRLPPAATTLTLAPMDGPGRRGAEFTAALTGALRRAGFALAEPGSARGTHPMRVLVTPVADAVLVRVQLDQTEAARLYRRDAAGALVAATPLTVREAPTARGAAR